MEPGSSKAAPTRRVRVFDVVRGFSVASMVLFHFCYDLRFIVGVDLDWFAPPLQDVWRVSISWTFLFVAGCMCAHSRSNLRRGLQYGLVALAIWVVTSIASVDTPISFGIIYCMAACTLLSAALVRMGALPKGPMAAAVLFLAFLALQGLPHGTVGIGPLTASVPEGIYGVNGLAWLGIPGPGFSSGDYYPLLPYLFLYLAGAAMGSWWAARGYPTWAMDVRVAPLEFLGRHALAVYVAHQPLLLALSALLTG